MSDLLYLIKYLLSENPKLKEVEIPDDITNQKRLLRSLMNVRPPMPISDEFLKVQDKFLQEELNRKGVVDIKELTPIAKDIYLWQGDITRLKVDAIVNAANDQMLGCFVPCHGCIDNAIHSAAGIQLRLECNEIMKKQGKPEPTGQAKITKGYNLPAKYVIHTVGPIVYDKLSQKLCDLLKSCYNSCLKLADKNRLKSIAFCCISTGEFHFPNVIAATIARENILEYEKKSDIKVVFNVFKDYDYEIYKRLFE